MCFGVWRILVFLGILTEMAELEELFGLVFEKKLHSDVHSIKAANDAAY